MILVAKDEEVAKAFGRRLRALREEKGLTQAALGGAAGGMKDSAIARLEAGKRTPAWDTVLLLAEALGVTPDAFLEDPEEKPTKKKPNGNGSKPKK